jgi:hypothetical protein
MSSHGLPAHLPIRTFRHTLAFRCHSLQFSPEYFNPGGSECPPRWAAPGGEFGVCYLALKSHGALIETLQAMPQTQGRVISRSWMLGRGMSTCRLGHDAPLRLVDLTGRGLSLLDIDLAAIVGDHRATLQLSLDLWRHPDQPDGVLYRSRLDPDVKCVALYDRARSKILFDIRP